MARHLLLPKQSFKDVRAILKLEEEKIRTLDGLFSTARSISPRSPDFVEEVSERLKLDQETANSVILVAQFLLTVVEEGHPPEEILNDVRYFVEQTATEEKGLLTAIDAKRKSLVSLITPKPERTRALKIRYLQGIHPSAEEFRTICELRPLFGQTESGEDIIGYVPTILLEVKQCNTEGDESQLILSLSPERLEELARVVKRAEEKLTTIRRRFGTQLLGDAPSE